MSDTLREAQGLVNRDVQPMGVAANALGRPAVLTGGGQCNDSQDDGKLHRGGWEVDGGEIKVELRRNRTNGRVRRVRGPWRFFALTPGGLEGPRTAHCVAARKTALFVAPTGMAEPAALRLGLGGV